MAHNLANDPLVKGFKKYVVRATINGEPLGIVRAKSADEAMKRAKGLYGRCVVEVVDGAPEADGMAGARFSHGERSRYPTPGFEARRAALIAAHKAGAL